MPKPLLLATHVGSLRFPSSFYIPSPAYRPHLTNTLPHLVVEMHFETGADDLKDLTTSTFVAAGRFRVEEGKPTVVEYKISKVVKGN